jgi:hypothetical protein
VLDANVLVPAGLRDLMLSCADVGVFRPVWQAEIEDEVVCNTARLTAERDGIDLDQARSGAGATMAQMRIRDFPSGLVQRAWRSSSRTGSCVTGSQPPRNWWCPQSRVCRPG